jgi:hypothetical protein
MVIDNLHIMSAVWPPYEADAPFVIDANAVLSLPVTLECLQPIARRHPKVAETLGIIDHVELAPRHFGNRSQMTCDLHAPEKRFRVLTLEALNHARM